MKKFFLYMTAALMMAACSSEGDVLTPTVEDKDMVPEEISDEVFAIVPDIKLAGDDPETRASLTYDMDTKGMKFRWSQTDLIGVVPEADDNSRASAIKYRIKQIQEPDGARASFESNDENITLEADKLHYAFSPWQDCDDLTQVPITYLNQVQAENIKMRPYLGRKTGTDEEKALKLSTYYESEKAASAHLSEYDYLVSSATTNENSGATFTFNRIGATIRFYLRMPEKLHYTEIQVVNKKTQFTVGGDLNIFDQTLSNPIKSHVLKLQLGAEGVGFDLTDSSSDYFSVDGTTAYVMGYMMVYPFEDLKNYEQCSLYLVGYDIEDENKVKKYFKADNLTSINFTRDKLLQWAPIPPADDPITFSPITVQKWEAGTIFTNGDGNGTGGF